MNNKSLLITTKFLLHVVNIRNLFNSERMFHLHTAEAAAAAQCVLLFRQNSDQFLINTKLKSKIDDIHYHFLFAV
ncbi:hypothetical protein DERF_004402 [Dermatophagoides farinae]|uniref:Uncharacterized protein n=1 Tax=Dermatophagoides farinae TaxID=6954 RepID=A0A922I368_DERFA|nr:hypothetical protein DERF_004402 [Dermatophagoides farinae]